ncbi:MAG: nodulation protein S NodS [Flavobacteriales bacterium]|nr:nodulation protein S NodS [Flavobacteriales bacterium]|tara:strand:+ start:15698 stop:16309 length:612 start_codon:yes stop_codon:yes gene_type:complete
MKAINLFNKWVDLGKDEGMVTNHSPSVDYMLNSVSDSIVNRPFSFLDIGCGNGWVVRKISKIKNCTLSLGIDGAKKMIDKAISLDNKSKYLHLNINNLNHFTSKFDVVFSMEVFYYLDHPYSTIDYIVSSILKDNGCFVIGVDHYLENTPSLSWKTDLDVHMCTFSIEEWKSFFHKSGLKNVKASQYGAKNDWKGTLVIYGEK